MEQAGEKRGISQDVKEVRRKRPSGRLIALMSILVLIVIVFTLLNSQFFTVANWDVIGLNATILAIACIGQTIVIISGGFDLSIGAVSAFAGVLSAELILGHVNPYLACIIALIAAAAVGAINGFFVVKIKINPLITTLGMMSIVGGITMVWTQSLSVGIPLNDLTTLGQGYLLGVPISTWLVVILYIAAGFFLVKTVIGRNVFAIGSNPHASRVAGIRVEGMIWSVYIVAALFAAFAGLIALAQLSAGDPATGASLPLNTIAAVVLGGATLSGGKGSILGTFLATLIITATQNGLVILNISSYYQQIVTGTILLIAVALDQLSLVKIKSFIARSNHA